MKNIIVLDVQKGYIDDTNIELIDKLNKYLKNNKFDHSIFTMLVTKYKDNLHKNLFWCGIYDKEEQKVAVKKPMYSKVFKKKVLSISPPLLKYLKENNITEVELCGIDNSGSVNLFASLLEKFNITPKLLPEFIYTSKIDNMKDSVDYMPNILKTINGFYVGDMIYHAYINRSPLDEFPYLKQQTQISDCTILPFAMIEWLIKTKHSTQDLFNILNYYYKLFPNTNNQVYTPEFADWAKNGCRTYRYCEDNIALKLCTPISWYSRSFKDIDILVKYGVLPVCNNEDSELGARLICYAIFWLRIGANRFNLAKKLKKMFNMDFFADINTLKQKKQDHSCTNIAYLAILIFTQTTTYIDAIKTALSFDCDTKVLVCMTSTIAGYYYRKIPFYDFFNCRKSLCDKFVKLLMDFSYYYPHL